MSRLPALSDPVAEQMQTTHMPMKTAAQRPDITFLEEQP